MNQINFIYKLRNSIFAAMYKHFTVLVFLVSLMACKNNLNVAKMDANGFKELVSNSNAQIIDLRTKAEFDSGHIFNSLSFEPNSKELDAYIDLLYKDVPVCIVGSDEAANNVLLEKLKAKGFKSINELDGGISTWEKAQFPLIKTMPKKIYPNDTITFDKAIFGSKLVMVDFNATWCKPCKMMQPSIDKVHDNRADEVIVYSIDIDKFPQYNDKYQIRSIPLLMLFKNGETLHRSEGLLDDSKINELIDKYK